MHILILERREEIPHVCTKEVVIDVDQTINFVPLSKKKKRKKRKRIKQKNMSLVCSSQELATKERLDMFITDSDF